MKHNNIPRRGNALSRSRPALIKGARADMEIRFIRVVRDGIITLGPLVLTVLFIVDHSIRFYVSTIWLTVAFFIIGCMDHPKRFMYALFIYVLTVVVYVPSAMIMDIPLNLALLRIGHFILPMLLGTLLSYWLVPPPRRKQTLR
jgi:hypothetical protein